MSLVARMAETQAIPFLDSTKMPDGLLTQLGYENWGSLHHLNCEKACCAARLGHLAEARKYALLAIEFYREDGRPWCTQGIELCQRLLDAIESSKVGELLEEWQNYSIEKLSLENLL